MERLKLRSTDPFGARFLVGIFCIIFLIFDANLRALFLEILMTQLLLRQKYEKALTAQFPLY
jgi:hypothetical protein